MVNAIEYLRCKSTNAVNSLLSIDSRAVSVIRMFNCGMLCFVPTCIIIALSLRSSARLITPFPRPLLPPARRLAIIFGMFSPGFLFTISASSSNSTIQPLRPHLWRETGWSESPTSGTLYSRFPPTSLVFPASVCFFY